ncbi:MAG: hypothetical protein KDH96_10060 [Candidatus Riesia sp.]|nr:hypothetical protein [Candidatus Riesia sp.]
MLRLMFNNYNKPPHYISLFVTKFSGFNYNHNFVIVFGYYYLFIFTFIIFHRLDFVTGYPNKIDPNINAEYL